MQITFRKIPEQETTKYVNQIAEKMTSSNKKFMENPYSYFCELRKIAPMFWNKKTKQWWIIDYAIANEVLRDPRFEKRIDRWQQLVWLKRIFPGRSRLIAQTKHSVVNENPPEHTRLRSRVNKYFTPTKIRSLQCEIETVANKLLDDHAQQGRMELMGDYAYLLAINVICTMLGVPFEEHAKLRQWSHHVLQALEVGFDFLRIRRANESYISLSNFLREIVRNRRSNPQDDLISALVKTEPGESELSEDEVVELAVILLIGGHETTVNLIGNSMLALFSSPEQLALLKEHPELIDSAIEEFLRFDSPVQVVRRMANRDMEFHGQQLHKDELLILCLGACNRDPAVFAEPDKLDITRTDVKHISFSAGIHHCVGAFLARMEARIAINLLLKRFPDLNLPAQNLQYGPLFNVRGLKELQIQFTPQQKSSATAPDTVANVDSTQYIEILEPRSQTLSKCPFSRTKNYLESQVARLHTTRN